MVWSQEFDYFFIMKYYLYVFRGDIKIMDTENIKNDEINLEAIAEEVGILELFQGTTVKESFYAYIIVSPAKIFDFKEKVMNCEQITLADYGEVIYADYGSFPPEEIQKEMQEKHGADHSLPAFLDSQTNEMMEAMR
jgi:hypothetical protein